jgi:2,3,4,5-tetrahydropyridine-2-carboxylate N-succinyltransferase
MDSLRKSIEEAWNDRSLINQNQVSSSIEQAIDLLNKGKIRIAEKIDGQWITHEWIKKAILLYFSIKPMEEMQAGPMMYYDKIPLKQNYKELSVRVVPHGIARYGAYLGNVPS